MLGGWFISSLGIPFHCALLGTDAWRWARTMCELQANEIGLPF